MAFEPRRHHDAEEETQARGHCCKAAPGGCAGVAGAERCRGGTLDWGYGGHVLPALSYDRWPLMEFSDHASSTRRASLAPKALRALSIPGPPRPCQHLTFALANL